MLTTLHLFYIVFGALTLVGGVIGYATKKSIASIISGTILGAMLLAASFMLKGGLNVALFLGLLASLAIAGKFIPDFIHRHTVFPAGVMAVLSAVSVALTIAVWTHFN